MFRLFFNVYLGARAAARWEDPLLTIATKEIYTDGKSRAEALTHHGEGTLVPLGWQSVR